MMMMMLDDEMFYNLLINEKLFRRAFRLLSPSSPFRPNIEQCNANLQLARMFNEIFYYYI